MKQTWASLETLGWNDLRRVTMDADIPQGYDAGHADIDLLRLRNYTIGRKLTDKELLGTGGMDRIADLLSCMKPFVSRSFSVSLLLYVCYGAART